jgi:hypothetical protein
MGSHEVVMEELPDCDFHEPGSEVEAKFDARTRRGPWAFMCQQHFEEYGNGRLGNGRGQRLIKRRQSNDKPDEPVQSPV